MYYSPPCSSVHEILQARILERVAMPSSRGSSRPRDWTHTSYISCIGRQVLYHWCYLGSPLLKWNPFKFKRGFIMYTTDDECQWSIQRSRWKETKHRHWQGLPGRDLDPDPWSKPGWSFLFLSSKNLFSFFFFLLFFTLTYSWFTTLS